MEACQAAHKAAQGIWERYFPDSPIDFDDIERRARRFADKLIGSDDLHFLDMVERRKQYLWVQALYEPSLKYSPAEKAAVEAVTSSYDHLKTTADRALREVRHSRWAVEEVPSADAKVSLEDSIWRDHWRISVLSKKKASTRED